MKLIFNSVKRMGGLIVITRVTDNIVDFQRKYKRHLAGIGATKKNERRK